jgi:glycosyltransferase involved in cell wall biosynthesis
MQTNEASRVKVSIGLPVRNGAKCIRKCVHSVLSQDFRDFELIISDNASTDGTEDICRDLASRDRRIRYVRQQADIGAVANFTFVLRQAQANSFMWLACDDYYESPGLVGALYEKSRGGAALAFPAVKHLDLTKPLQAPTDHAQMRETFRRARSPYRVASVLIMSPIFGIAVYGMFNLGVLRQVRIDLSEDVGMLCFSDGDIIHRIIAASGRLEYVDSVVFVYSKTPGSLSSATSIERIMRDYLKYSIRIPVLYARSGRSLHERLGLVLRLAPAHVWLGGILVGAYCKRRLLVPIVKATFGREDGKSV